MYTPVRSLIAPLLNQAECSSDSGSTGVQAKVLRLKLNSFIPLTVILPFRIVSEFLMAAVICNRFTAGFTAGLSTVKLISRTMLFLALSPARGIEIYPLHSIGLIWDLSSWVEILVACGHRNR